MTTELQSILDRIERSDPATAQELRRQIALLSKRREFGLNFDRHVPERVALPGRPVSIGDKVHALPARGSTSPAPTETWIIEDLGGGDNDRIAKLRNIETGDLSEQQIAELVFVADFRDPIYPGLRSVERLERGEGPFHTVINGENYHVLDALRYTYASSVDLIYIDPPYNTGNEGWIYNDRYVSSEDGGKHSMWLAFMERRLRLAWRLLKATGVIVVAIGDDEHHRLRMLLDQVFGDQNFLANITWQGTGKNDARYSAGGVDYMLVYARDESALSTADVRWREHKPGFELAVEAGARAWSEAKGDPARATKAYRAALRGLRGQLEPAVFRYDQIDDEGRIFQPTDLGSPNPRPNLQYDLAHPRTGRPVKMHPNGWRYSPETMQDLLERNAILFGEDEQTSPRLKRFLADQPEQALYPTFTQVRMPASNRLQGILGDRRFPYPKDHEVLMRWIGAIAPSDALVLDYFGGSGTTTEAVMRLNEGDGGTRRSILVTNNELAAKDARALRKAGHRDGDPEWEARGVFEYVTRPRISTVVTGIRPDGSNYSEGLAANVEFFDLTYENPALIEVDLAFKRVAPLLWLRAGAQGTRIDERRDDYAIADAYAVLFSPDFVGPFLSAFHDAGGVPLVFVVTDDESQFQAVARQLPAGVETVRLYSSYLDTFTVNTGIDE